MSSAHALCPRCHYDQRGTIETWNDSCPLRGRCCECGLEYEWGDVLNPFRGRLPGLVEHARGVPQLVRWTFTTFGWIILPHRFWKRVELHHTISLRTILLGPLLVMAVFHFAAWVLAVIAFLLTPPNTGGPPASLDTIDDWWLDAALLMAEPFARGATWYSPSGRSIYVDWTVLLFLDRLLALVTCVLAWPLLFMVLPITRRAGKLRWSHIWRAGLYPFWWLVVLHISDRLIAVGNSLIMIVYSLTGDTRAYQVAEAVNPTVVFLANTLWFIGPAWILAWWYVALRRGFRLERAGLLWAVLGVAVLAASAIIFLGGWYLRVVLDPYWTPV